MNKDKNKNKGFTLIEILVVVLIIGILAAISVVQYQKSVLKSRFTALMPITKALYEGEELFAMSSGKYTDKLENLDISTTGGVSGSTANINGSIVTLGVNNRHTYVKATRENFDNNLIMFQKGSRYFPGEIHCEAKVDKSLANWLCEKELGGEKLDRSLTEGYTDYVINGDGNGVFPKDWVNVSGSSSVKKLKLSNGDTCTGTEKWECHYVKISDGECNANNWYDCRDSIFVNSTCNSITVQACNHGSYTDSSCIANGGQESCTDSSFLNSTCEGSNSWDCHKGDFKDSRCIGNLGGRSISICHESTFDNSECIVYGTGYYGACYTSTYKNKSSCVADGKGCYNSTFENSTCTGNGASSCEESTFTQNSVCNGNNSAACQGSTFKDNSICYANEDGACGDSKNNDGTVKTAAVYEGNACCKGIHCPDYAPKCDCAIDSNTGQHALSC